MLRRSALFSLLDQLLSAAGLFLFTFLVSQALNPQAFGALSVTLSWGSLLGTLLQPALIDSSTVLGARADQGRADWSGVAIRAGLVLLAATIALVVLVVTWAGGEGGMMAATVAASEVAVSLLALLRRSGYAGGPHWLGLVLSLSNLVLTALIVPVCMGSTADPVHALYARLVINALTALPTCWWLLRHSRPMSWRQWAEDVQELLQFSRTYISGSVIFWVTNSLQVVLIGHALSMADAAGYRAAQLLILPMTQLQAAIFQLAMPRTVAHAHEAHFSLGKVLPKLCMIFGIPAVLYALALIPSAGLLLEVVFGQAYVGYTPLVLLMGLVAILDALKQVAVIVIYALDHKSLLMRYRIWALGLFVCGIAPALWWGNVMAFVLVNAMTSAALLIILFRQLLRSLPKEAP